MVCTLARSNIRSLLLMDYLTIQADKHALSFTYLITNELLLSILFTAMILYTEASTTIINHTFGDVTIVEGAIDGLVTTGSGHTITPTTWLDTDSAENVSHAMTFSPAVGYDGLFFSETEVRIFSHVTRSFVNSILCILGFIGNSLGVGVLLRQAKQHKLSIFWYLCGLTLTDIIFLGLGIIDSIPRVVQAFDLAVAKYLMAHFRLGLGYFDNIFLHSARFIVLVMSCERLISVMKPLHVKETWFAKFPVRIIVSCVLFNAIFALPILINATVVTKHVKNTTEYIFTFTNYNTFMAHWWVAEAIVHSFVPTMLLIIINLAIPFQLYRSSNKLRAALNKDASSQQGKVTATVMTITLMYIFLSVPLIIAKVLQYVNPEFNMNGRHRLFFWFFADLGKCLAYINAANDFLIYFLVSNNYRAVFKAMYCSGCSEKSRARKTNDATGTGGTETSKAALTTSVSG